MDFKNKNEISFVLGTKAQLIKCKFILKYFADKNYKIIIIDTGQHIEITQRELHFLKNNYVYINVSKNRKNVSSIPGMIFWFFKIIFKKNKIAELENSNLLLVHGDTISTLIGLIIGKKNKKKVVHIEAGYSSGTWLKPFPEEIVRAIVTKFSDIICIDNVNNKKNIERIIKSKKVIYISRNTIFDSVASEIKNIKIEKSKNLIVTVHRTENVYSRRKFLDLTNLLIEIRNLEIFDKIIWYAHDITKKAIKKYDLTDEFKSYNILIKDLIPHNEFIKVISSSQAIITDGGSIVEECSILNLPTVIWRDVEEKINSLGDSVFLSNYDKDNILSYLKNIKEFELNLSKFSSPSEQLVNQLIDLNIDYEN